MKTICGKTVLMMFLALTLCCSAEQEFSGKEAWLELEELLVRHYVYLHDAGFDARAFLYRSREGAATCSTPKAFIDYARIKLRYFHDPHLNLDHLDKDDYSLIPTGSDIWALKVGESYVVEDVKSRSAAYRSGVRPGMRVLEVDDKDTVLGIADIMDAPIEYLDDEQENFALNILLGGKRYKKRSLLVDDGGNLKRFELEPSYTDTDKYKSGPPVVFERIGEVGYIRFENSLGREDTVPEFRRALQELLTTRALIVDLRNIPSGGNTAVARPILGHFTQSVKDYQLYRYPEYDTPYYKQPFLQDKVQPQLPFYPNPVVVLAGRWTGSMGEGMAVGFEALGVRAVVGAPLADLLGGIFPMKLTKSGTELDVPGLRIYQTNGMPREDYVPSEQVSPADTDKNGGDPALAHALSLLQE